MFVNFMDLLRQIKLNIYPDIVKRYNEIKDNTDTVEDLEAKTEILKDVADAYAYNAKQYAVGNGNIDIKVVNEQTGEVTTQQTSDVSARNLTNQIRSIYMKQMVNMLRDAEALEKTANSLVNAPENTLVHSYLWNDATQDFDDVIVPDQYSVKNYADKISRTQFVERKRFKFNNTIQGNTIVVLPFEANKSTDVYVNRLYMNLNDDYVIHQTNKHELHFSHPLNDGDTIIAVNQHGVYLPLELNNGSLSAAIDLKQSDYTASSGQTVFVVNNKVITNMLVFVDGLIKSSDQYVVTISGNNTTVTLSNPAEEGAKVTFAYMDVV